jgi:hypothetical protein
MAIDLPPLVLDYTAPAVVASVRQAGPRSLVSFEAFADRELGELRDSSRAFAMRLEASVKQLRREFVGDVPNAAEIWEAASAMIGETIARNSALLEDNAREVEEMVAEGVVGLPESAIRRFGKAIERQLLKDRKTLVDTYYEVMAIFADLDPEARPAPDAPVLTSGADVEAYFNSLQRG